MAQASGNGSAQASTEDLSKQIATLRDDLSGLTDIIADMGKAQGERLGAAASDQVKRAQNAGKAAANAASEQAELAKARSEDFVRTQPATALGIAVGVGFLVGWLSGRK